MPYLVGLDKKCAVCGTPVGLVTELAEEYICAACDAKCDHCPGCGVAMEVPEDGDADEVYVCVDCGDDYVAKRVADLKEGEV